MGDIGSENLTYSNQSSLGCLLPVVRIKIIFMQTWLVLVVLMMFLVHSVM